KYTECDTLAPYHAAGKPIWNAEYTDDGETTAMFCASDASASITGALFSLALDGSVFMPCSDDAGITN
ncbi:MAG TPA: endo alpha-1,4 polygalactosaminidase, partial [Kofleriaceae bacterium]|nr:endo alpha-1,4 polygalactosaminidase [Kofleriaceae bacterium]